MKTTQLKWPSAMAALVLSAGFGLAAESKATLQVGDSAPKLQTGKWVQGEPVKDFEKGKAYIVEFWATWCGPCRVSIPHLNEIWLKYKDKGLVVIGQDCFERDDKLVAPFVEKMGEKMTYRVALDDKTEEKSGQMAKTWMEAAGQNGIPTAFIVDTKGLIAWIGHPMTMKDSVLKEVLDGTYDVQKAAVAYKQEKENEGRMQTAWTAVNKAMQKKDWDEAMAKLEEVEKLVGQPMDSTRFSILLGKEDYPAAYKLAAKISEQNKENAMLQNQFAWQILTDKSIKERDLKLAETMAARGNEAAKGKDANILDTLARAQFMLGQKDKAIASQEKAVSLADNDGQREQMQKTLDSYKKGELSKVD